MRLVKAIAILLTLTLVSTSALAKKGQESKAGKAAEEDSSRLSAETFKGLQLRGIGPAFMSGRIADVAVHPHDQSTWYVGVGSGGVWKTTNAGTTWTPIFDGEGSYSIGCVTLDPSRPETVWVGTGENVSGRHVGYGDGVYRSLDGGKSWQNMGLVDSEHIGTIVVDPRDSDVVYVAAQGPLWSPGGERGLYKTSDGGETWEKLLGGGDYTGANEVAMDPRDPDVLYVALHQRFRTVAALVNGGPESAIHKSVDGGQTWRQLKSGLPEEDMGKIGLAVSPIDPDIVYATIELAHRKGGFYRSADGGETWEKRNDYHSGGTGPHYYQEIFASPHKLDRVYQMDVRMNVTEDGGTSFRRVGEESKHGDNHALAFDPGDPDYLLAGSDGGLYESWDLGKNWKFVSNLPITQFYKVAVDYAEPFYNVYGGTQDNSSQGGPSRTTNLNGIRNSDWFITNGGDGHQPAADPTNPMIVYAESQQGNPVRHDRSTGETVYIQPQPEKGEGPERWNWDTPILISPHDPARLYYASQRVWRSDDRGDSWRSVSGDLSRAQDRLTMPMMGRVQSIDAVWDLSAMSSFGNVTSLSESPLVEGLIYAGTDDGLIQVTGDGGESWRRIEVSELPGVPANAFVNDLKADLHDADTVYAVVDDHKSGDFKPYVAKSTDRGVSWTSIAGSPAAGGLPERHLVWRIVQDHVEAKLLFLGTEFGIFFTLGPPPHSPQGDGGDGGWKWIQLTGGVPNIPFRDLVIQKRENDLVGASFGRSLYVFDDYTPLRHVSEEVLEQEAELFPVKDAWWYIPRRPLGRGEKATQGAAFFVAPNPPFGAVITYYLRDELKTSQAVRSDKEKEIAKEGGDTPYPGWEELRREDREEEPAILLTVRDAAGEVVRRLSGPVKAGFHRVAWDLRYPALAVPGDRRGRFGNLGFLAAPGTYSVHLAKRVNGVVTELGKSQSFEVVSLVEPTLKGMEPAETVAFLRQVGELQRVVTGTVAVLDQTAGRLTAIREALMRSTVGDTRLDDEVRALEGRLHEAREALQGYERQNRFGEPIPPSITRRLRVVLAGNRASTYGPTPTHLRSYEIAVEELGEVRRELVQLIETDLKALEEKLEAAGVPWTPGRGVPALK